MYIFHSSKHLFLIAICSLGIPNSVHADSAPLDLTLYGSFLHTSDVPHALFFFSGIEENDSFDLRKALRVHQIDTIVLSSGGGSVWEGLQMAGIIHDKGLTTYIPEEGLDGGGNCASACSFMFFAGANRIAKGDLGVHQFYSENSNVTADVGGIEKGVQFTASEIIAFLNEFDTPPFVFERMFQQSDMYYFDDDEMNQITTSNQLDSEIGNIRIDSFIASLADNLERQRQLLSLEGSWEMSLCSQASEVEFSQTSSTSYSIGSNKIDATLNFPSPLNLFENMSCSLYEDNKCVFYEAEKLQASISGRYFFQSRGYDDGLYSDGDWIDILEIHNSLELEQEYSSVLSSDIWIDLENTDPDSGCELRFWKLETPAIHQIIQD